MGIPSHRSHAENSTHSGLRNDDELSNFGKETQTLATVGPNVTIGAGQGVNPNISARVGQGVNLSDGDSDNDGLHNLLKGIASSNRDGSEHEENDKSDLDDLPPIEPSISYVDYSQDAIATQLVSCCNDSVEIPYRTPGHTCHNRRVATVHSDWRSERWFEESNCGTGLQCYVQAQ